MKTRFKISSTLSMRKKVKETYDIIDEIRKDLLLGPYQKEDRIIRSNAIPYMVGEYRGKRFYIQSLNAGRNDKTRIQIIHDSSIDFSFVVYPRNPSSFSFIENLFFKFYGLERISLDSKTRQNSEYTLFGKGDETKIKNLLDNDLQDLIIGFNARLDVNQEKIIFRDSLKRYTKEEVIQIINQLIDLAEILEKEE